MHTDRTLDNMDAIDAEAQVDIAFSRSAGLLSQAGNADAVLKTLVSDQAADDWRMLARGFGMNSSELLRIVVNERLYGVEGLARMTQDQIARVTGKVPKSALKDEASA